MSELSFGDFSTGAEVSGQLGPTKPVPRCLGSELSWVQSFWFPIKLGLVVKTSSGKWQVEHKTNIHCSQ